MHRIGFRRALPLAFTLIHVVLAWFSLAHQPYAECIVFYHSKYRLNALHQ
jgi:hypothetical protein